jgi:hypothetical protein
MTGRHFKQDLACNFILTRERLGLKTPENQDPGLD